MKVYNYLATALFAIALISCDNEDDTANELTGEGTARIEFDNSYAGSQLLLQTAFYDANGTEKIAIDTLKYIVSNIRLEDAVGNVFVVPEQEALNVIDLSDDASRFVTIVNVPAADYVKIHFGLGIDQEKYLQGVEGQGDFLTTATEEGMLWSWQAGYKFIRFEGRFTGENTTEETPFAIHMGSHGTALDNYKEVSLDLPVSAKVRTDITPEIHLVADISQLLSGTGKLYLEEQSQIHVDPEKSPMVATNAAAMFTVDHIHN
ncbi:MbnP family protein [Flavobacterium sp. ASW18X]|uniref:MbnP family protein n=1 Tax=Flavobacterium sp. ASW18X TaxID=2572595 RepID=UPI0010ADCBB9|nr:MbnP family protein [Flavobacterium sp. ASW18X]TKD66286.1 hypothetical protein FBT53_05265 [Flavobacterium sp. ASW18X]